MNLRRWRSGFVTLALCTGVVGSTTLLTPALYSQETTGGLQGTVKDATGAVVAHALVAVTNPSLTGIKSTETDGKGNYRFSNLPPGPYVITVKAKGFATTKREGLNLEVGHLPTVDLTLAIGSDATVVEVSAESQAIDVTTTTTQTNITSDVIQQVPRGRSYQSVIQFAPAASNEPLMGNTTTNGSGSVSPGNGSNGNAYGYSVAGGSDSENSYLVEGQETANLIGGYSHTNVPFDFIEEVQIKTSGIAAEHGGSLGGVINVIMKKGSAQYHGSVFTQFENQALDSSPSAQTRYDPNGTQAKNAGGTYFTDPSVQGYHPLKAKSSDIFPGFNFGGPLLPMFPRLKDKLFFFVGFNPELSRYEQKLNYGPNGGIVPFSQNTNTYYTTARIDASVTNKIRVFGSWLYQLQRQNGETLPVSDSSNGLLNPVTGCYGAATGSSPATQCTGSFTDPSVYSHSLGFVAPNITVNTGADITVTQNIVATTRFGYYFENYHDFGYPRSGVGYQFQVSGTTASGATDFNGQPLPASLQQGIGFQNQALNSNFAAYNSNKAIQLDQDLAWFKSTGFGTHNFKFGYQLNRLSNLISQTYNIPYVQIFPGNVSYSPGTPSGAVACAALTTTYGGCQGQYGYAIVYDFGTGGRAVSYNNGLFAQDSWTVGHGLTIDAGIRFDKEFLPGEAVGNGAPAKPINFNWTDKIAPRVGAAWDVFRNGKMKVFGDYGVFYDIMKLNLAISSFGGQYWQNCAYALNTSNLGSIDAAFNSNHRDCSGPTSTNEANFASGKTPAGLSFIENLNNRAFPTTCSTCSSQQEGVAPNLKPYRQHEAVFGVDYQVSSNVSLEARFDRRRLDHVIEDSAIYNPAVGETFVVVNPGQGVNATYSGFCSFLYGAGNPGCDSSTGAFPPDRTIPAARSYDGFELRINKGISHHWAAMASYTYSHFRGNYTGLTSSDISDGGFGGRNSPNNSRAFDEPYFSYNAQGGSSSGLLPTDRPNKVKGYGYYELGYLKRFTTDLGVFQTLYQGSPNTSYANVGYSVNAFPVQVFNRGTWADVKQDPTTGVITVGTPRTYRNPWYNQTDFNFSQSYKISEKNVINFTATFTNVLNQHSVTSVNEQIDSSYGGGLQYIKPSGLNAFDGSAFYAAAETPYSVSNGLNKNNNLNGLAETVNSQYGQPLSFQLPRTIRLAAKFTF